MAGLTMSLTQQMRQKQVLAPQMRQSLEVLQLQVQDLCLLAQQELEQNPTLELMDGPELSIDAEREAFEKNQEHPEAGSAELGAQEAGEETEFDEDRKPSPDDAGDAPAASDSAAELTSDDWEPNASTETVDEDTPARDGAEEPDLLDDFRVLSALDDADYFYQAGGNSEYNPDLEERRQFMFDSIAVNQSLQEHLINQLDFSELDEEDVLIAEQIIGSIDDDGYLRTPLADIAQVVPDATLEDCERVLVVVQDFTPPGVGARTLGECLLIQVLQSPLADTLVETLIREHLDLLEARQLSKIAKICDVSREEVEAAIALLAKLDPRPGSAFDTTEPTYIIPEIDVRKVEGRYKAFLEDTNVPQLRISRKYSALLMAEDTSPETREYVQGKIRSGLNFIKSIEQRQETIRHVAQTIVDAQQAFFDDGVQALRPLVMAEVAEVVGVHETTVSRTVSNKYMRSPQGIHELRYFFTSGIPTTSGADVSSAHVKQLIRAIVDVEDPEKPLADLDIEKALADQGINIARRTIAKYRGMLKIPASHLRRRQ